MERVRFIVDVTYLRFPSELNEFDERFLPERYEFNLLTDHTWLDFESLTWKLAKRGKVPFLPMFSEPHIAPYPQDTRMKIKEFESVGYEVKVVCTGWGNDAPYLPWRDPAEKPMKVLVTYNGEARAYELTLSDTVSSLKRKIIATNDPGAAIPLGDLKLFVKSFGYEEIEESGEGGVTLSQAIRLDCPPEGGIEIVACSSSSRVIVDVDASPLVFCMEVSSSCRVNEFKNLVAERVGADGILWYGDKRVEDSEAIMYDALHFPLGNVSMRVSFPGDEFFISREENNEILQPTRTTNTTREADDVKIVVKDGTTWTLTGDTYETITADKTNPNGKVLMVNQEDTLLVYYEINFEGKKVKLSTSQCMIVDNGYHEPYVLINPSGKAKLNRIFQKDGVSMLQDVKVNRIVQSGVVEMGRRSLNIAPEDHAPAMGGTELEWPTEDERNGAMEMGAFDDGAAGAGDIEVGVGFFLTLYNLIVNNRDGIVSFLIRYGVVFYLLNLHGLVLNHYATLINLTLILGSIYIPFFSGHRVTDWIENTFIENRPAAGTYLLRKLVSVLKVTNALYNKLMEVYTEIQDMLITVCLSRPYEFEYVMIHEDGNDNWIFWVIDTFNSFWKEVLLFFISFNSPTCQAVIMSKMDVWRRGENEALELKLSTGSEYVEMVIEQYQSVIPQDEILRDKPPKEVLQKLLGRANITDLGIDIENLELAESREEYYQIMLAQLRELNTIEKIFTKAISSKTQIPHN